MSENAIKIGLLGNSSVGKSSLIRRFVDNKFDDNYMSTIGVDYFEKKVIIKNTEIKLIIQDTSGEERFRSISKNYYKNVDGIIFVFDVTNQSSFNEGIKYWLKECNEEIGKYEKILVGNKIDLNSVISKETIEKHFPTIQYFETSAKEGTNVEIIFKELVELILKNSPEKKGNKSSKLGDDNFSAKKKCC